jgi:hypothetical protein
VDPTAMILRFGGDPDDLLGRFETARQSWIATNEDERIAPTFYAACKAKNGIVVVMVWPTDEAHKSFGPGMRPHLQAAGISRPDSPERQLVDKLGWT